MEKSDHKFPYRWNLSDGYPAHGIDYHGAKVFSCFACGGGSTMGYKLAGYDVIGANDIDPKMEEVYKANHNPKHYYLESITTLKDRDDFPEEFYNLDILDGSPPCSSFSMAGNRKKDWGKKKKFREGQAKQVLDTLFFDFIELANKLRPKVVIAENVKGIIQGEAIKYVRKIREEFDKAGYYMERYLLDASKMGVPQRRERVFFIAVRKDICPKEILGGLFQDALELDMRFREREILWGEIKEVGVDRRPIPPSYVHRWENACPNVGRFFKNGTDRFGFFYKALDKLVFATLTTTDGAFSIEEKPERVSDNELALVSSFPIDYNYMDNKPIYLCGMSVPPICVAQVSLRIKTQILDKLT